MRSGKLAALAANSSISGILELLGVREFGGKMSQSPSSATQVGLQLHFHFLNSGDFALITLHVKIYRRGTNFIYFIYSALRTR